MVFNRNLIVFIGNHNEAHVCRKCLTSFYEYKFLEHQIICLTNEPCTTSFPKEDWLSFEPKN